MSVGETPAQPGAGPAAVAAGAVARALHARLRMAAVAGSSLLVLAAVLVVAAELAAARVPQQRAALEQLIRRETGLDVSFRELSVRWGWYGPEAVFHAVTLGEPAGGGALLSAPQLVVGLDAWRMVRSGHFEAGRITLISPDIDLGATALTAGTGAVAGATPGHQDFLGSGARVLSRWRGGRIDVQGGTLRVPPRTGQSALTFGIRHAQLRRLGASWSADASLLLPAGLGSSAHLALTLTGDPAEVQRADGTLSFEGRRLEFGGWQALSPQGVLTRYLPRAGGGNLELRARFAHGELLEADGSLQGDALEWSAPAGGGQALALGRLSGRWHVTRLAGEWHFAAGPLQLGEGRAAASLSVVAASEGGYFRGQAQQVPVAALAAVANWYAPALPGAQLALSGVARELTFDWSEARPASLRLQMRATLEDLTLASADHEVQLSGLRAQVRGAGQRLVADLTSHDARLALAREQPLTLEGLNIAARLALDSAGAGWRLSTDDLEVRRADLSLAASGELTAEASGRTPHLAAHVAVKDADAVLAAQALGSATRAALGLGAAPLLAGRIASADFVLRGPLDGSLPWGARGSEFTGALTLREARVGGGELWPEMQQLEARLDWSGPHLHAVLEHARSGTFELSSGSADWDARGVRATHLVARLAGSAHDALGWLREHPQLVSWAAAARDLDVRGATLIDLDLTVPPARKPHGAPLLRVNAALADAQLRPLSGLPPIESLRGTLAYSAGRLQRSTLSGQWLGGPVSLAIAEHREHGLTALAISGRGVLGARQALRAAGADARAALEGTAEWSALLSLSPVSQDSAVWRLRADSNLVGVASRLPEPFAKPAGAALPLRVELQGAGERGELQVSLSDRLRARAALERSSDGWRIGRGAVALAATAPELPANPVLALDGRLGRLDLAAWLALWREASADAALPALVAHVSAAKLVSGTHEYPEVRVVAEAAHGAAEVRLGAAQLAGTLRWPARIDGAHPARADFARFDLAAPEDAALGAALATLLAPALELTVGDLSLQGRALGQLQASLAVRGEALDVSDLRLTGASGDTHATVHCLGEQCAAQLKLESTDAAATLAALGMRPELTSRRALFAGQLQWSALAAVPLASLNGHLHMEFEDGLARAAPGDATATPFALLAVPALMVALNPEAHAEELRFSRFTAAFELHQGEATTSDLHFDGDAEILVRGRVGLVERDYDQQAWILHGEERLPAPVRRLGAAPRMAAVWLSLRELFTGTERGPATLRLRGTWSDPIVGPAE
jgi:uncharacterized protein YhdP